MRPFASTTTALIVLIGVVSSSTIASAEETRTLATSPTTTQTITNNPRSNFAAALKTFTRQIDQVHKNIAGAVGSLNRVQKLTPAKERHELDGFRAKLLSLGQALNPDAPFPQAIERFDSWVSSEITRLNNQRASFPSQQAVEELLAKYRTFHKQVESAREMIATEKKEISQQLRQIDATENLASEWLLVGEAQNALKAMNGALDNLKALVDGIKTKVHEFSLTAAQS